MKLPQFLLGLLVILPVAVMSAEIPTLSLWPGAAPGDTNSIGEEKDTTKTTDNLIAGKRLIRLGNVSKPTLTIYRAPKRRRGPHRSSQKWTENSR